MNNIIYKIKRDIKGILICLLVTVTLGSTASCNNSDDLDAIFLGPTWRLSFLRDGDVVTNLSSSQIYTIRFFDGTFTAGTPSGAEISGKWEADGSSKNRTFSCTNIRVVKGDISGDHIATNMIQYLQNANSYDGTTIYLQLKESKNKYIQFYNR